MAKVSLHGEEIGLAFFSTDDVLVTVFDKIEIKTKAGELHLLTSQVMDRLKAMSNAQFSIRPLAMDTPSVGYFLGDVEVLRYDHATRDISISLRVPSCLVPGAKDAVKAVLFKRVDDRGIGDVCRHLAWELTAWFEIGSSIPKVSLDWARLKELENEWAMSLSRAKKDEAAKEEKPPASPEGAARKYYSLDEALVRMKENPGLKMTMPNHYRSWQYNYYDAKKKEYLTEDGAIWDIALSMDYNELYEYADVK